MPHVHDHHCETADVGSVCDCECAGAKHAILHTKGGVPGAGAVTRRAQKIAHTHGRAPVVNGRAERADGPPDTPPGRHERGARRTAGGETVRSNQKPARVSPATAAKIVTARQSLPVSADAWKAAARVPLDPAASQSFADERAAHERDMAGIDAQISALYEKHAQIEAKKIGASREGKAGHYGSKADILAMARTIAPHRAWEDPEWDTLTQRKSDTQSVLFRLDSKAAAARAGVRPVDTATGLVMPSAALNQHLHTVVTTGRAFLADAKREIDRTGGPQIADARAALDYEHRLSAAMKQAQDLWHAGNSEDLAGGGSTFPRPFTMPDGSTRTLKDTGHAHDLARELRKDLLHYQVTTSDPARRLIRVHERDTIMAMMAEHRPFGGVSHTDATAAPDPVVVREQYGEVATRADWRERLTRAEQFFPADWLRASAAQPLQVGSSKRAFYNTGDKVLSMAAPTRDKDVYDGAFDDATDEVTVHELGHRMETLVPGLTALEFAMVRRHATRPDGTVQPVGLLPGYSPNVEHPEVGQPDEWADSYTGKSYEGATGVPDLMPWELFQVGLQDTLGRGSRRFGSASDPDELQAFVIGALLTL